MLGILRGKITGSHIETVVTLFLLINANFLINLIFDVFKVKKKIIGKCKFIVSKKLLWVE